ncbi:MAG: DUF4209 domain-containing protein [Hymenobacter sp.]|nr:MAG: DUF4209 domain-containing protein [Hymenobacter sp.]
MRERLLQPEEVISEQELYERLELRTINLNGTCFEMDFNATNQIVDASTNAELAERLAMECGCQMIHLDENYLSHPGSWKDNGTAESYLKARYAKANNKLLRLRYGLLIALGLPKGRHTGTLAIEAIEHMLQWLKENKGLDEDTKKTYYDLVKLIFVLSKKYKHKFDIIQEFITGELVIGAQPISLQNTQLQFLSKHTNIIPRTRCAKLGIVCQRIYEQYSVTNSALIPYICDTAIYLAARAAGDTKGWNIRKGNYFKSEGQKRYAKNPSDFVTQSFFTNALRNYRLAGDKKQVEQVEYLISTTKNDVRLDTIEQTLTLDGEEGKLIVAAMKQRPQKILALEGIFVFWAIRYLLIPNKLKEDIGNVEPRLWDIFRHNRFDRNGNITTRAQKRDFSGPFHPYSILLGFYQIMTREVFADGLRTGKITYQTTLTFLQDHTWVGGATFRKKTKNENDESLVTWIEPALRYYFAEVERAALDTSYKPEMTLCIDSLTLKIEGLLRRFCQLATPPIATNRTSASGDQQELTLEDIIKSVEEYSDEHVGYYLRFVFTKEGWNVRNNIAHGFTTPKDYTITSMQRILVALFVVATMGLNPPEIE